MKTIRSMLAAILLSLYTFCTSRGYAPSLIFGLVMSFVFVALSHGSSDCIYRVRAQKPGVGVSGLVW